jgi:hypothetical protein
VLLIYTTHITPRLHYIASTLFGGDVSITDDKNVFTRHADSKINYTEEKLGEDSLHIVPFGLIHQSTIQPQDATFFEWKGLKSFFSTNGDIPFDIFSASFYLIARYEEYLPHRLDMYGRFAYEDSIAYKENFLHLPLVQLWWKELSIATSGKIKLKETTFTFSPTYDIDIAYSYLHQPLWKNVLGFFKDLLKGNFDKVVERANVYSGWKKDPFDVYDWLDELHEQHHLTPTYFFLLAAKQKGYDKNLSPKSNAMKALIERHTKKYTIGIHPSWQSGDDSLLLASEIKTLEKIIGKEVEHSRQHYIRMQLPLTYRQLIANKIEYDHSMGYGSINGFRSSYSLPFKWYDVEKDVETSLTLHPFCYMEANSYFEQQMNADEAADELQQYHDILKSVDGELSIIFHNHFLTEQIEWLGWRKMYADFLEKNF